jgi:LDH2 family malate/lactate/ureidoglycolate dehydrogenase
MVLDMATSAIAYFELIDRARRGVPAPPDVGFDSAGRETTDAAAILDGGAIRPFDRWALSP